MNTIAAIPLLKLVLNVVALAVLHLPLALLSAFYTFAIRYFWDMSWECFPFERVNFILMLKTVLIFPLLARIIIDAVLGVLMEKEFRRAVVDFANSLSSVSLLSSSKTPTNSST